MYPIQHLNIAFETKLINDIRRAVLCQDVARLRMLGFMDPRLEALSFDLIIPSDRPRTFSTKYLSPRWFSLTDNEVLENYRDFLKSLRDLK